MAWLFSSGLPSRVERGGRIIVLLGVVFVLAVGGLQVLKPPFIASLESLAYDIFVHSVASPGTSGAVVIVDLDEKSIDLAGQWPWPRYKMAALLEKIKAMGASSVGLDMVFAEPDRSSPTQLEQQLLREFKIKVQIRGLPDRLHDHDALLADILARGSYVLGFNFLFGGVERSKSECLLHPLSAALRVRPGAVESAPSFHQASGVVCNLRRLAQAAGASGFFDAVPDPDGRLRRIPLVIRYQDTLYPSLALATFLRARGLSQAVVTLDQWGIESLQVRSLTVPLDAKGNLLINYRGPRGTFPYISAADILLDRVPPEVVRDKIVLVGTSAAGLQELRATPLDLASPGVEIHATVIDNLLRGDFLHSPSYTRGLELGLVGLLGIAASLLLAWAGAAISVIILAAGALAVWLGCQWLLASHGLFVSPVLLLLVLAVEFSGLSLAKFWRAERQARQRNRELALTQDAAIQSLAALGEVRDAETGGHIIRTRHYVKALAVHLSRKTKFRTLLDEPTIEAMHKMAPLHDVGKIGIRDAILLKPGNLSAGEFEEMKKHTVIGHRIFRAVEARLGPNSFLRIADELAHSHHERWDGKGYPIGLQAGAIPLAGRIMALVDVYDALINRRVYKPSLSHEEAVAEIKAGRGEHFDPEVVDAFVEIEAVFKQIGLKYADPGQAQAMPDHPSSSLEPR
jgi:adenylate cyclase